jgi:hypothetical protein
VKLKLQLDLSWFDVWVAEWAPVTTTQRVSLLVLTLSVNGAPCLA